MDIDASLLGLNKYELSAYESLVKGGKNSASRISKISGVPYGRIYDILSSLESKGLVKVIPEDTKKYMASEPKNFIDLVDNKKEKLVKLKKDIKELQQIYESAEEEPVLIAKGKKNFWRVVQKLSYPKEYEYIFRSSGRYRPSSGENIKKQLKEGVNIKTLLDKNKTEKKDIKEWNRILPELKNMRNEGIALSIIDDKEVMIGLINSNTTLFIRNEPFARLMKKFYENTYKKCNKIK